MNTTAALEMCSPIWADYVWLARREVSRLRPAITELLLAVEDAGKSIADAVLKELVREGQWKLIIYRCKWLAYYALFRRTKQIKYRDRIARARRLIRDAAIEAGADLLNTGTLSRIMNRCGSDKGNGHHNYTLFYERLFGGAKERYSRVFELGIGSSNPDVPSNMGVNGVPGASLRGWKEYFPTASIFGGDVDEHCLFNEERIATGWVDQTKPESVDHIFESFGGSFDLIIDDGLHDVEANRTFFERAFLRLRDGGIFVIEDVPVTHKDKYKEFLDDFDSAILEIPNRWNRLDNCIAVVIK